MNVRTMWLMGLAWLCSGCAIWDPDRRHLLGAMDEHLAPESEGARWALAPVGLPAGVAALVVDGVIVHPATQFDDAWYDTQNLLWEREDETPLRAAVMTPVAAVATPFVYTAAWVWRAIFNIDDWEDDESEVVVDQEPSEGAEESEEVQR